MAPPADPPVDRAGRDGYRTPDAMGRGSPGAGSPPGALAAGRPTRRAQRRRPGGRRPGSLLYALPPPDRAAPGAGRGDRRDPRRMRASSATGAATTWSRSTWARSRPTVEPSGDLVLSDGGQPPRRRARAWRGNDRPRLGLIVVPLGTCTGGEDERPEGETRGRSGADAAGGRGALWLHGLRLRWRAPARSSRSSSSTSPAAPTRRPRRSARRSRTASTRSRSSSSPPRPTPSASSSSAASAPRTTRSTSSAWTSSGRLSSPTRASSSRGRAPTPRR